MKTVLELSILYKILFADLDMIFCGPNLDTLYRKFLQLEIWYCIIPYYYLHTFLSDVEQWCNDIVSNERKLFFSLIRYFFDIFLEIHIIFILCNYLILKFLEFLLIFFYLLLKMLSFYKDFYHFKISNYWFVLILNFLFEKIIFKNISQFKLHVSLDI